MKDFDRWNSIKKKTEYFKARKRYHAGDIWWIIMGQNIGFEQDGKNEEFQRPALVIKGFNREICLIVPLTTIKKNNRFYLDIGIINGKKNYAIISQIRLIDTKRLVNQIGFIQSNALHKIKNTICMIIK